MLQHYQSGAQTRLVPELMAAVPETYVEVHPDTATRAGLADGDLADVVSRRGTVRARVRCVPTIRVDLVFLPFHFPGDGQGEPADQPGAGPDQPDAGVQGVRGAAGGSHVRRKIVIVGYGMAGARLAEEIRRRDTDGVAADRARRRARTPRTTGSCCPVWSVAG